MSDTPPSSINEFVRRDGDRFLRSTSRWTEQHLLAFKCLWLENLPVARVIPSSFIPADDDVTVRLVRQQLSATEDEIRSRTMPAGMGYSFYLKLAQVLQRPSSPPPPIPIPQRSIRQSSLDSSFQISPGMSDPSTDSSYIPPPTTSRKVSILAPVSEHTVSDQPDTRTNPEQSRSIPLDPRRSLDSQHSHDRMSIVGSGSEWGSVKSLDSIEEDKLEIVSNQMGVTFLELLAAMEYQCHGARDRRIEFRYFFNLFLIYN